MLSILKANTKITFFFIGCAILLLTGSGFALDKVHYKGIVTSFKLNIRKEPLRSSDVVSVVEKGETVDVLQEQGDIGAWLAIEYKGDKGYIRNRPQYIKLILVPEKKEKTNDQEAKTQEKQKIKVRIQTQEKMVETFSQKEVEIIEGLNEIDYSLNKARIKVLALSTEIMQLEGKIELLNQDRERLAKEIDQNRDYAGKRLRALYKMNMIGRLEVAGLPTSIFDFFLQQNSMKRITASDFQILEKQNLDLEKFEILEMELQKEILAKTSLETQFNDQIRINQKETLKKELILKEIRQKKKLSLAAVESLKEAELQLDNRISSIQKGEASSFSTSSFSSHKGRLLIPVKGDVISDFGPSSTGDYKSFTFQKGIDIRVERGEPVKSVFKGEIMFAQWLKGYGNLLIIDHGDNYYTLYAHVEEIFKQKGETVETGEVIATAGDTGSIKGMCLHFEVRHHGKPVNPMKWLRKGA
ncbi:MAG: peptidoglycan DD-metalloendopeptidase family protein [Proteobacteria bacterium]|nr:peptidoglycan DD-metalloendopeptidase family protein [Pseudomonadota bacterium]MBU1585693.1 peptidoglycan DD-metalloendopeptidase family protein [Pseudomonadota bacterium]MBU2629214.1 peptidoglycan DD-metalloendopeptidase family protein [Pseudomonadota bacterium]